MMTLSICCEASPHQVFNIIIPNLLNSSRINIPPWVKHFLIWSSRTKNCNRNTQLVDILVSNTVLQFNVFQCNIQWCAISFSWIIMSQIYYKMARTIIWTRVYYSLKSHWSKRMLVFNNRYYVYYLCVSAHNKCRE